MEFLLEAGSVGRGRIVRDHEPEAARFPQQQALPRLLRPSRQKLN